MNHFLLTEDHKQCVLLQSLQSPKSYQHFAIRTPDKKTAISRPLLGKFTFIIFGLNYTLHNTFHTILLNLLPKSKIYHIKISKHRFTYYVKLWERWQMVMSWVFPMADIPEFARAISDILFKITTAFLRKYILIHIDHIKLL